MNHEKRVRSIGAALKGAPDFVIKNAKVINVFTDRIVEADVAVFEDTIIGVGSYDCENCYDAEGRYLSPGLIDAHVHIESSMVIPSSYARVIIPFGTTSVIADPHEIANVAGMQGIRAMYKLTEDIPLNVLFMLPSCVPATPFENSGAVLLAEDLERYMYKSRVLGLGEVMDYVSVSRCEPAMMDKLELFKRMRIDGHAPLVSGNMLNAYCVAGPGTDHECTCFDEVYEKLQAGMKILVRIGSAAIGVEDIFKGIVKHNLPTDSIMFCSDDKHIEDIRRDGHINHIVRTAVKYGIPAVSALKMASYNAARTYGIRRTGAIAPGYKANMALFDDLTEFNPSAVFTSGKLYKDEPYQVPMSLIPNFILHSVNTAPITAEDLKLKVGGVMPIIHVVENQLLTKLEYAEVGAENGFFRAENGLSKLAVLERHHASGNVALGIVKGMPVKNGTIASTVAHDSHNMVVLGDNDRDMLCAIETLRECDGGIAVVSGGVVIARLPLPIAGLMTDTRVEDVLDMQQALLLAARSLGINKASDPLVTLSFLALPVIPEVRLTDEGLFDVQKSEFIYRSGKRKT